MVVAWLHVKLKPVFLEGQREFMTTPAKIRVPATEIWSPARIFRPSATREHRVSHWNVCLTTGHMMTPVQHSGCVILKHRFGISCLQGTKHTEYAHWTTWMVITCHIHCPEFFRLLGCYAAYVINNRRFGNTYTSHLQGRHLTLEGGTNR